jgi:hypothetical protein
MRRLCYRAYITPTRIAFGLFVLLRPALDLHTTTANTLDIMTLCNNGLLPSTNAVVHGRSRFGVLKQIIRLL